jgi:hypothetical protein
MRAIALICGMVALAQASFAQGTVRFINRGGITTSAAPGQVLAPIYREDPSDPTHRISGNTPNGVIPGNTSYNGAAFVADGQGPTFIAALWALNGPVVGDAADNDLQQVFINGSASFRTATSGTLAGIWIEPAGSAVIQGAIRDTDRPTLQVRVWDTKGGTIATWDQVISSENNAVLRGYSELFTLPFPLGFVSPQPNPDPYLQGLQSFNLFVVPEPSAVALFMVGVGCLIYVRRSR